MSKLSLQFHFFNCKRFLFYDMSPFFTKPSKRQTLVLLVTTRLAFFIHYSDVTISAMAYKITGFSIVCSIVCSCADQRKYQSSAGGFPSQRVSNAENVPI